MSPLIGLLVTLLLVTPPEPLAGPGNWLDLAEVQAPGPEAPQSQARYDAALRQFADARERGDANEAGRALATLDELRPEDTATLRARADLAKLRGDSAARERALRDLMAVDATAPGAASELVDTLLRLRQPASALAVARRDAPERLASDRLLQAYERNWVSHLDLAAEWRGRSEDSGSGRLDAPHLQLAAVLADDRWGRLRLAADGYQLDAGTVAAGQPFGSSPALLVAQLAGEDADGVGYYLHFAPQPGLQLELGQTPQGFAVRNIVGALRTQRYFDRGPLALGLERSAVTDSLLSFAGARDPVTGRSWGGVVRNRAYVEGSWGSVESGVYGSVAAALLSGRQVEDNSQWEADLGFWRQAATGQGWNINVGGHLSAMAYTDNLSRFTLGHGGYFSPQRYLSAGPTFDLHGRLSGATIRIEGGLAWQLLREEASAYFPDQPQLQAASGDPFHGGDSREGLGGRLAATVEWRLSQQTVAGLRLEGYTGEDYEEVRLQVYARHWRSPISEPLGEPPRPMLPVDFDDRY